MRKFPLQKQTVHKNRQEVQQDLPKCTGGIAAANDIVHFNLPLQQEAMKAHTVDTVTYNLLSMNMLRKAGYLAKFIEDLAHYSRRRPKH